MPSILERLGLRAPAKTEDMASNAILAILHREAQRQTFKLSRGTLDQFIFPDEDGLDDWGKLAVRKLRTEIDERFTRYHSFDICCVRDFMEEMRIPQTQETRPSFEALHKLHCMKFHLIPKPIFERIPHWFNHLISAGQVKHPLIDGSEVIDV